MRDSAILVGLTFACAALAACPATLDDRCSGGACAPGGNTGDGGDIDADATAPDAAVPPDCVEDADASAPEAKACMDDDFAFFVDAAGGKDTNDGSKAKPFKSIGAAVTLVPAKGKRRIYICGAGPYPEHVKLTTAVHLFGGFACADWTPDAAVKPKVAPSDAGYALHVDGVAAALRFEDIAFEAMAGTAEARSSIAVFVANSPNTQFKRAELSADAGFDGTDGTSGSTGTPTSGTLDGNAATDVLGGDPKICTCSTGGTTTGGAGGDVNGTDINGTPGLPTITPSVPDTFNGAGQTQADCNASTTPARTGSNAPPGLSATKPVLGILGATGWKLGDGASGQAGSPGQGGGGGGSRSNAGSNNGGGGGGGCGGCGGSGGTGGTGGGASIALLALGSPVNLIQSTLTATRAGKGGVGRDGGSGGGGGGNGQGYKSACDGNIGGNGGKGGAGAGGAGGISAAVLYKNGIPVNDGSTLKHGTKGAFGAGGKSPDNDGPDGLDGELVEAP